jgi:two-component system nitrogen regulation sensor histidine kinase NtrY
LLMDNNTGLPFLGRELSEDTISDIVQGIEIVKERSIGMSVFVEQFRSFTLLPKPTFEKVKVSELFNSIKFLIQAEFKKHKNEFSSHISNQKMVLFVDVNMVEQMLINMIQNAIQAGATIIDIRARGMHESGVSIEIIDNGQGIDEANIDQIFIPFFTTKSTGTGVGLSLARQIMRYHHGSIQVNSAPGVRTVFKITF